MKTTLIFLTIAAGTMFANTVADNSPTPAPVKKSATIEKRKDNQQKRIAKGVASGSLTAKETAKLENKEVKLNQTIAQERTANGGKLTAAQKRQVAHRQNAISKDIAKEKHDAQTQK